MYANIVHAVKKCYKIKIDYRDFRSCFYRFLQLLSLDFHQSSLLCITKGLLLQGKEALIAMQRKPKWRAKVVCLKQKGGFLHVDLLHTIV